MCKFTSPILICLFLAGCYSPDNAPVKDKKKSRFVFKETLVQGKDTGMVVLGNFKRNNPADVLCQHWELGNMKNVTSIKSVPEENSKRIPTELIIFGDSSVVENPRSHFSIGRWRLSTNVPSSLTLIFTDKNPEIYLIRSLQSHSMVLAGKGTQEDSVLIKFVSDGKKHQNMYNDPFHPVNNLWRIKPGKAESDSAIKQRVRQCIKFYALFFRDNIKRQKPEISFAGLPEIFEWYKRGIGLPDRALVEDSWVNCFYNKQQALKGYDILRTLIVDYEFDWPKGAPNWVYETHSVLEQMYAKLK